MTQRFYSKGAWLLGEYARERGILEKELAPELNISPQQISSYLLGRGRPSLDKAIEIEKRYGIPVSAWGERQRMDKDMAKRVRLVQRASSAVNA